MLDLFGEIYKPVTASSIIPYVGGKQRARRYIVQYFPRNIHAMVSPFCGGAAIELFMAAQGVRVYAYDIYGDLVNFWQCVSEDPRQVAQLIPKHKPYYKEDLKHEMESYHDLTCDYEKAAAFWCIHKTTFGSLGFAGIASITSNEARPVNASILKRIEEFYNPDFSCGVASFEESLAKHPDVFAYLDPPYYIKSNIYGKKGELHSQFNHGLLCDILHARDNWVLSYNNCDAIQSMYKGFHMEYPKWSYGMGPSKGRNKVAECNEILIINTRN